MKFLIIIFFLGFSSTLICQRNPLFTNANPIEEQRYKGVKGNPYQFDSWVPATIYTIEGDPIEVEEFNINGYSKEIEIRKGDKFIELIQSSYKRIEVILPDDSHHIFVRDFANYFRSHFVELVHDGEKIQCVRQFEVPMIDFEIHNVGKTEKIKRFNPKFTYVFIKDQQLEEIKVNEKKLIALLGYKKELGAIMSKTKFKTDKLKHLKEILSLFESL